MTTQIFFLLVGLITTTHSRTLCLIHVPVESVTLIQQAMSEWNKVLPSENKLQQGCPSGDSIRFTQYYPDKPGATSTTGTQKTVLINNNLMHSKITMYNVILHELGHVLDLKHPPTADGSVMSHVLLYSVLRQQILEDKKRISITVRDIHALQKLNLTTQKKAVVPWWKKKKKRP